MTSEKPLRSVSAILISLVWFVNGFFCKILNLVPRHQQIVQRILGADYGWLLTKAIGVSEVLMVVWILSKVRSRLCALFQIAIVGIMNIIEFVLVPDLLLFGRMNIVFAFLFMTLIFFHEFVAGNRKHYVVK
jgi:hypothetical protein